MHEIVNIATLMVLRNCKIKGNRTISIQTQTKKSICGFNVVGCFDPALSGCHCMNDYDQL